MAKRMRYMRIEKRRFSFKYGQTFLAIGVRQSLEALPLIGISTEYIEKKDHSAAARFSAAAVAVAKLGRDFRALAGPTPETEGKGDQS